MVEPSSTSKSKDLNSQSVHNDRISKGQSFNTDEESSATPSDFQQTEENNSPLSTNGNHFLGIDQSKRSLLSLNSPSIDSINDPEGSISDVPISERSKKKKQRRLTEHSINAEASKLVMKRRAWYTKINLTKPILFLLFLLSIYIMWTQRDTWIPRLLTSNTRLRQTTLRNDEKLNEKSVLSTTKNSSLSSINQDEIVDDKEKNNDQTLVEDLDDSPTTSNKHSGQKINLRARRAKITFSRERHTQKRRHSQSQIIDDDDEDDDDDDDVDDVADNDEVSKKSIKAKEFLLPSSIRSSKKHHHHRVRSNQSHQQNSKSSTNRKTSLIVRPHADLVEQLRQLIKSHGKNRDLSTILRKQTGLSKTKINRFIHQKDFSVITLDVFISLLNSFHSTILILSK